MARIALNMSVSDPRRFDRVLEEAKHLGFEVQAAYAELGVLSGSIDSTALVGLHRIPGLVIERDRSVVAIDRGGPSDRVA